MKKVKKMAFGGLPSQAQATLPAQAPAPGITPRPSMPVGRDMQNAGAPDGVGNAAGAMRGLDRAGAMSGRTMPTIPVAPATVPVAPVAPAVMPAAGMGMRPAGMKKGGKVKESGYAKGGSVSSASKRADGCAQRGKTRGKMV